jgi:hypothetical protein
VYVTGESWSSADYFDYITIKYDSTGSELWIARYNYYSSLDDRPTALTIDPSGNVYVTGSRSITTTRTDYTTIKYDSAGNQLWEGWYRGPIQGFDVAVDLAVDPVGNVYVTGFSDGDTTGIDYATVMYDSSGTTIWAARYNGPGNGTDIASALIVDTAGNVFVTGKSERSGTGYDYTTVKYDNTGTELWVVRYDGPSSLNDSAADIVLDSSNNIYISGQSNGSGSEEDFTTIMYNPSGTEMWSMRYDGPGNSKDFAASMAIDVLNNIYVTGKSMGSGTNYDFATIKYSTTGTSIDSLNWFTLKIILTILLSGLVVKSALDSYW